MEVSPATATGLGRSVVLPSPNSPLELYPQQRAEPSDNVAQAWTAPVDICFTSRHVLVADRHCTPQEVTSSQPVRPALHVCTTVPEHRFSPGPQAGAVQTPPELAAQSCGVAHESRTEDVCPSAAQCRRLAPAQKIAFGVQTLQRPPPAVSHVVPLGHVAAVPHAVLPELQTCTALPTHCTPPAGHAGGAHVEVVLAAQSSGVAQVPAVENAVRPALHTESVLTLHESCPTLHAGDAHPLAVLAAQSSGVAQVPTLLNPVRAALHAESAAPLHDVCPTPHVGAVHALGAQSAEVAQVSTVDQAVESALHCCRALPEHWNVPAAHVGVLHAPPVASHSAALVQVETSSHPVREALQTCSFAPTH